MGYANGKKTTRRTSAAKQSFRKKYHRSIKSKNDDLREKLDRTLIEATTVHTVDTFRPKIWQFHSDISLGAWNIKFTPSTQFCVMSAKCRRFLDEYNCSSACFVGLAMDVSYHL